MSNEEILMRCVGVIVILGIVGMATPVILMAWQQLKREEESKREISQNDENDK